jgi:hypothetical protein
MHRCNKNDTRSEWVKEYVRCNSSTTISYVVEIVRNKMVFIYKILMFFIIAAVGSSSSRRRWQRRFGVAETTVRNATRVGG